MNGEQWNRSSVVLLWALLVTDLTAHTAEAGAATVPAEVALPASIRFQQGALPNPPGAGRCFSRSARASRRVRPLVPAVTLGAACAYARNARYCYMAGLGAFNDEAAQNEPRLAVPRLSR